MKGAAGPVTATRNGRAALVTMVPEYFDGLLSDLAHECIMRKLDRAEADLTEGSFVDGTTFTSDLLVKHDG